MVVETPRGGKRSQRLGKQGFSRGLAATARHGYDRTIQTFPGSSTERPQPIERIFHPELRNTAFDVVMYQHTDGTVRDRVVQVIMTVSIRALARMEPGTGIAR